MKNTQQNGETSQHSLIGNINLDSIGAVAFFGLFYAIGLGLLGYGLWCAWQSRQVSRWPATPATISKLGLHESCDGEGSAWKVQVQYTYQVDGISYEGARVAFGYGISSGRAAHDQIFRTLKDAKSVSVRYDSRDPSVSCLSHGVHRSIRLMLAFAIFWLLSIGGMSYLFWMFSTQDAVLVNNLLVK